MCDFQQLLDLRSIRTLAQSWDIAVGDLLEKYMDDVSSLVEDESSGVALSFPQAALIIKNSSTAYTRKVVALSKQVIQVSADITNGRRRERRSGGALANTGSDVAPEDAAPLDDVVDGGAIDLLDEDLEEVDEFDAICGADPMMMDEMREDGFGRPAVSWAPAPTFVDDEAPIGVDVHADVHAFLTAVRATNDGAGFRMSMCPVDEAGALVVAGRASSFGRALGEVCEIDAAPTASEFGGSNDGDDDDFGDGGDAFGSPAPMVTPTASAPYALRQRDAVEDAVDAAHEEEEEDPWMLLDFTAAPPPSAQAGSSKLRKGHPYRLPRRAAANGALARASSKICSFMECSATKMAVGHRDNRARSAP